MQLESAIFASLSCTFISFLFHLVCHLYATQIVAARRGAEEAEEQTVAEGKLLFLVHLLYRV